MKTAVVTLHIPRAERTLVRYFPDDLETMSRYSYPTMLRYAKRIGADFHILRKRRWPDCHFFFEKFQLCELFDNGYDRVLYVDGDALIRGDAPNIFDLVPPGRFAAVNEGLTWSDGGHRLIETIWGMFGAIPPKWTWDKVYMNAGVFVVDRESASVLRKPTKLERELQFFDQGMLNLLQQQRKLNYFELDKVWNFMPMAHLAMPIEEIAKKAYIAHISSFHMDRRLDLMRQVLRLWGPTYQEKGNVQ